MNRLMILVLASLVVAGCDNRSLLGRIDDAGASFDGGGVDANVDGGPRDGGPDGAPADADRPDGARFDGSLPDGSLPDGSLLDGALLDGALLDGAQLDGAPPDAAICGAPRMVCDDECVDTRSDPTHCGGCDSPCTGGLGCDDGASSSRRASIVA